MMFHQMLMPVADSEMGEGTPRARRRDEFARVRLPGHRLWRAPQVCLQPATGSTCSAWRISWVVLSTVSGFSEMLSMPQPTKNRANSG